MLTHLLKLTWNKKKQNFLLMLEIFISFIGLFAGLTFVLYPYNNYKLPAGLQHEGVWVMNYNTADETKNIDSLKVFQESVKKVLLSMNGVENVTYCSSNIPFSNNASNTDLKYNGERIFANVYSVEENYINILGMKILEGRWFNNDDAVSIDRPIVINDVLKKKLFGDVDVIGKLVESDAAHRMKIVGVVSAFKHESELEMPFPGFFQQIDTSELRYINSMMVKVKPGADAALESRMYKTLSNTMTNANIEIEHLTDMKDATNKRMQVPFIIFIVIASFLIINVALGIFGVLWYNINKRRGEIGLRRAVGASGKAIYWQLVVEAILIATLSLMLGSFFAVQFPLLKAFELPVNNYITAIILSILFIYVLVIVCALYPGKQAAGIYPATALHED